MKVQQLIRVIFVCGAVLILPGCAVLGGGKSKPAPIAENATVDNQVDEVRLRAMVDKRLSESQQHSTADNAALNFSKPYFYKEYVDYPDGIQGYTLEILESDSKGTPYSARISLAKKRYVTKLVKKKSQARSDDSYSEAVGVETLSYEFAMDIGVKRGVSLSRMNREVPL